MNKRETQLGGTDPVAILDDALWLLVGDLERRILAVEGKAGIVCPKRDRPRRDDHWSAFERIGRRVDAADRQITRTAA